MADRYYTVNYDGNGGNMIRLQLHLYTIATDIINNKTTERADLYAIVDNASYDWWNGYGSEAYIGINGHDTTRTVTFDYRSTGTKNLITSWDTEVAHNNQGKATIWISAHHYSDLGLGNASIPASTYECDIIPRYATCNQSLATKTVNSIKINWSSDSTIDYVEYSKDGGTNWVVVGSVEATSGNYTISGLTPNTPYSIKTRVKRKDSQLKTESSALSVTTYDIAKITSSYDWIIGENIQVEYSNPSGAVTNIAIYNTTGNIDYASYRATTASPYTFVFTNAENTALYNSIPDDPSGKVRIYLRTTVNGTNYYDFVERTIYVRVATNTPTFEDFEFADTNNATTGLTGNNQILVNGYSNITTTISTANKATAKNGATMSKYRVKIGTKTQEIAYSSSASVSTTINAIDSNVIEVSAIDSRGFQTKLSKTPTIKMYTKPTIEEIKIYRENSIGTKVLFDISGKYWNESFGNTTNTIRYVYYRYREKNSSAWSNYIAITNSVNFADGEYSGNSFLPTTDNGNTPKEFATGTEFVIQINVVDALGNATGDTVSSFKPIDSGIPCTAKRKTTNGDYEMGINQLPDTGYALAVKGKFKATEIEGLATKYITGQEIATNDYVDGKRVYAKRFDCGYLNVGSVNTPHGLTFSQITIVRVEGYFRNVNSGTTFPIPRSYPTNYEVYNVDYDINSTNIELIGGTAFNGSTFRAYMTLYYTKN